MSQPDYLIVGAGFFGAVMAERLASQKNKKVLVIDRRDHIGGNSFSSKDSETGIEFHHYGTHIFHTSAPAVMDYLSSFMTLNSYIHQVLTVHRGKVFQMPINLETINSFYDLNLRPFEVQDFLQNERAKEPYPNPQNLEEKAINSIGRPLYEAFIKGYTAKQWGTDPKNLPAEIINRLPVRSNYNENYFHNARWQGIPSEGFGKVFENLLDHQNIEVKLGVDYFELKDQVIPKEKTIYSGPIDRYFEYQFGRLSWRSIFLERKVMPHSDFQGTSVMNYADKDVAYTRVHEPLHLHPERDYKNEKSLIFYETSGMDDDRPFYPIRDDANKKRLAQYQDLVKKEKDVIFGGRLGTYSYFDMDQVIAQALTAFKKL